MHESSPLAQSRASGTPQPDRILPCERSYLKFTYPQLIQSPLKLAYSQTSSSLSINTSDRGFESQARFSSQISDSCHDSSVRKTPTTPPETPSCSNGPKSSEVYQNGGKVFRTTVIFIGLSITLFLAAMDTVLITTALPSIAKDMMISDSGFAWIGSSYMLGNATFIPFWGKVSDIFGRKTVLLSAVTAFLIGSLVSALSTVLPVLIAGRSIQGVGAGGIVVLVNVIVSDLFLVRDRGLYLGILGAVWAIASALGPVLGGFFAEKIDWRWCFWINLPLAGLALILIFLLMDVHVPKCGFFQGLKAIDWLGSVTISSATVTLLLGLQFGGVHHNWTSPRVLGLMVTGMLGFVFFGLVEWRLASIPIMPLRIFSNLSNLSALGVCFFDAFIFNSVAYFLPLYFQLVLSQGPLQSGCLMLALAIPLSIFSASAGWVMQRMGRYLELLRLGLALITIGLGLFITFDTVFSWTRIILYLGIVGVGFGPNFHAPLIALQARLSPGDIACATGAFGFVRMLSGAMGVVLGQVVFATKMKAEFDDLVSAEIDVDLARALASGDVISHKAAIFALPLQQLTTVKNAILGSLSRTWLLFTVMSALGLLVGFGIRPVEMQRQPHWASFGIRSNSMFGRGKPGAATAHEEDEDNKEEERWGCGGFGRKRVGVRSWSRRRTQSRPQLMQFESDSESGAIDREKGQSPSSSQSSTPESRHTAHVDRLV